MERWIDTLQKQQTTLKVILGNHDRDAHSIAEELGFLIFPEPTNWHGIELAHHPDNRSVYRIAGHVHPQMELKTQLTTLFVHVLPFKTNDYFFCPHLPSSLGDLAWKAL